MDFMIDFIETHVEFILEFLHVLFPLDGESFWPRNSTKMWKYFTHRETLTYVDVLSEMVASYDHTVHRTIGISPAEVTWANQTTVSKTLYGRKGPEKSCNFLPKIECDSAKPNVRSRKDIYPNGLKNCLW